MDARIQFWFMPWRWSGWSCVAILPALVAGYLLSEAPVTRINLRLNPQLCGRAERSPGKFNGSLTRIFLKKSHRLYRPAHWIYDHTPLHRPLRAWAELWGVDGQFEDDMMIRKIVAEFRTE